MKKISPAMEPGRLVLRRQPDGKFKQDWIFLALVVVGIDKRIGWEITEDAVPLWGSSRKRVQKSDLWVNYVRESI